MRTEESCDRDHDRAAGGSGVGVRGGPDLHGLLLRRGLLGLLPSADISRERGREPGVILRTPGDRAVREAPRSRRSSSSSRPRTSRPGSSASTGTGTRTRPGPGRCSTPRPKSPRSPSTSARSSSEDAGRHRRCPGRRRIRLTHVKLEVDQVNGIDVAGAGRHPGHVLLQGERGGRHRFHLVVPGRVAGSERWWAAPPEARRARSRSEQRRPTPRPTRGTHHLGAHQGELLVPRSATR